MKQQSTSKGFAILSAGTMIVKLLSLLYVPFLVMIIGDEAHGVYSSAYIVFTFVYVITNSGIPVAISKLVAEYAAFKNYRAAIKTFKIARGFLIMIGLIMSLLLLLLAGPIADVTDSSRAYLAIAALSPSILITSIMSAYRGYFQGMGNMTPTAVSQIAEQVINIVFSLLCAALLIGKSLELGVLGATIGTTVGALFALIYLIYMYNKSIKVMELEEFKKRRSLRAKVIFRKFMKYSIPITLSVAIQNAGNLVDMGNVKSRLIFAGFTQGITDIKFSALNKYTTLINVPIAIITALSMTMLPAISAAVALRDRKLINERVNYAFKLCFLVAVPSTVAFMVLSKPMFKLLYPTAVVEGTPLLFYGAIVVVLMSVVQIQNTVLQSIGKLYVTIFTMTLGLVFKVIVNYIFVAKPEINILGAIIGNIVYFIIPLVINARIINKTLKIRMKLISEAIRPLIASLCMGVFIYGIYYPIQMIFEWMETSFAANAVLIGLSCLVGGVMYFIVLILIGGITREDLRSISPKLLKLVPEFLLAKMDGEESIA
jgi:stage V sporulation protein B